jgi:hypothetical protein
MGYLCVPAEAQFIKALMRRILSAIWAKAAEPVGRLAQMDCAAPGEVRHQGPNPERRKSIPPPIETRPAVTTHTPLDRDEAKSAEKITQGERLAGADDHRLLLHGIGSGALNVPAGSEADHSM